MMLFRPLALITVFVSTVHAEEPRLLLDVELTTHARFIKQPTDNLSELRLDRGEVGARVGLGPQANAELRLEALRSAADGGALGVDGDSMVVRVRFAQVMGWHELGQARIDGAIGFVPDPWLRTLETDYPLRPLSRTGSERLLGWPASDLAAVVGANIGPVRAVVSFGNGEGLRYPERNDGKTTTAVVAITAIDHEKVKLTAMGLARDGSLGVASIQDRRFGGGITAVTPWVRGGVEVVAARGVGDRGDAKGTLAGGWMEGSIVEHVFASARGSTFGFSGGGGRLSTFGGAVSVEPWPKLRLWLAVDRVTASGGAMPVPGADAGDATIVMLIASAVAPFKVQ